MLKPIRNSIQCKKCCDVISSMYTHDFKTCSCRAVAVDGGFEYMRVTGDPEDYIDLSIFENKDGVIGTVNEANKFVSMETMTLLKNDYEQLFVDFLAKYDSIYDFSSSLDVAELQVEMENSSTMIEDEMILPVEKFVSLFDETFLKDIEYYQPSDIFVAFKHRIIFTSK